MSDRSRPNLLESRGGRRLLFAALYFSEGAPIGFVWWALPTLLRERGADVDVIGAISAALVLPWAFKFLWAPLVDTLRSRYWGFRSWIVAAQLLMGVTLLPLLVGNVLDHLSWLKWILIAHAFCAATQDVSVDALCIASSTESERGALNGWMQAGMLAGRAAFGGGALMLVSRFGLDAVVIGMVIAIWSTTILVLFATRESEAGAALAVRARAVGFYHSIASACSGRATWLGLLFAATAGAGFEAIGAMVGPFLTDLGVPQDRVGTFYVASIGLTLIGALFGGWASDRFDKREFVSACTLIIAVAGGGVALASRGATVENAWIVFGALGLLYLVIGLFTASSYALLMDLTDPALGGTQFSAFMGATNLCEAWAAFAGGALAARIGYASMFAAMSAATLVGVFILFGMGGKRRA